MKSTNLNSTQPTVVGIGEALFDCFPDRIVLGGAPINVAIHANALVGPGGGAGVPVTRVGKDENGQRFFTEARQRGLDIRYVQTDEQRATGRVDVLLDAHGHAEYRFGADNAWDALEYSTSLAALAGRCNAVAFGTLGQRSPVSRQTISRFLSDAQQAIRLFDVNLRQDFYSAEVLDHSLQLATAAKLNEDELLQANQLLELRQSSDTDEVAFQLAAAYQLDWLALTRGAKGTVLYAKGTRYTGEPSTCQLHSEADSVGAGDACCAGLLCGMLLGWKIEETLMLANRLGAYVASQPGATPALPSDLLHRVSLARAKTSIDTA